MISERETQIRTLALAARSASRCLAASDLRDRNRALRTTAELLMDQQEALLQANAVDRAENSKLAPPILQRLKLDESKLQDLALGLESVAAFADPIGRIRMRRLLDDGLELTQVTCPLGSWRSSSKPGPMLSSKSDPWPSNRATPCC